MSFVHNDPEFDDVLRIVAIRIGLPMGLVEKDYFVTHALWALQQQGFEVWFKGGTSLSGLSATSCAHTCCWRSEARG